jgi:predicted metal-dependent enzyme (double-stranded beta helix superfamily)
MFTIERFIEQCRAAIAAADAERTVEELVAEAVSDPASVARALRDPERAGFAVLHRGPELTLLDFASAPWMTFKPHDHSMWSVVGIFSGREDNVFWRRTADGIEARGARSLGTGDVTRLGRDVIHSVVNPIGKMTRAIHVYGGDFFAPPRPRSEWDPETLAERPWDLDHTRRLFAEADARAGLTSRACRASDSRRPASARTIP